MRDILLEEGNVEFDDQIIAALTEYCNEPAISRRDILLEEGKEICLKTKFSVTLDMLARG